jgi:hypothetical protein
MKTRNDAQPFQVWLYDGKPEFVDVSVGETTPLNGGYVLAIELATGIIRLAATRQPAKYLSAWRHNVRRYGIPSVVRVLVSQPFLRYEAVKRSIAALLADYKEPDSEDFRVGIDFLMARAEEVFAVAA